MFARFTEPARQVVVHAQDEARGLRHNYIGTEHLLLGVLREERGLGARVLASVGVTLDHVRGQVRALVGDGDEVSPGQIPFTPRAKKVLELALREAQAMSHQFIGTEHLLLGLAREDDGVAMRILTELGVGAERIRREVIRTMGGVGPHGLAPGMAPGSVAMPRPMRLRPPRLAELVVAWVLGAATLGVGILVGWAIWG